LRGARKPIPHFRIGAARVRRVAAQTRGITEQQYVFCALPSAFGIESAAGELVRLGVVTGPCPVEPGASRILGRGTRGGDRGSVTRATGLMLGRRRGGLGRRGSRRRDGLRFTALARGIHVLSRLHGAAVTEAAARDDDLALMERE